MDVDVGLRSIRLSLDQHGGVERLVLRNGRTIF